MTFELIHGDARHASRYVAPESVDLIVTSPPYFALRSYRDGDEHYDGQIGSEPTPTEFLDALIACTADWLTVLKPGGSLWVNLGDSYSGSGGYNNSAIGADGRGPASYKRAKFGNSKDGAPAQWTQQNAAWLAALIDGEGSISVREFTTGTAPSFVPWVRVGQMDSEMVVRAHQIAGVGRVWRDKRGVWNWGVSSQASRYVLERIWPWLLIKQKQALAAIDLAEHIAEFSGRGRHNPLTDDAVEYRRKLTRAVRAWNARQVCDIDLRQRDAIPLPHDQWNVKAKSLNGLPWRYALRCIDELGLILRAEVIWSKPNGLPESVTDRVRRSHEQWFHFTRQGRYFAAVDEVREGYTPDSMARRIAYGSADRGSGYAVGNRNDATRGGPMGFADINNAHPLGKLPGSVWTIPTEPLIVPPEVGVDHFAAFPSEWPRRIILGWSPSGWCVECGEPRRPVVDTWITADRGGRQFNPSSGNVGVLGKERQSTILGYACACPTTDAPTTPSVILDPFGGTGTVAGVAHALGRHGIHIDLSRDYLRLAKWRIEESGLCDKVRERSGIKVPEAPAIDGQLDLFGEAS